MFKFLFKEVQAQSGGNGTGGVSRSGKGTNRKSEIGGNSNSTRPKAEGAKRNALTKKKGGRVSDIM